MSVLCILLVWYYTSLLYTVTNFTDVAWQDYRNEFYLYNMQTVHRLFHFKNSFSCDEENVHDNSIRINTTFSVIRL